MIVSRRLDCFHKVRGIVAGNLKATTLVFADDVLQLVSLINYHFSGRCILVEDRCPGSLGQSTLWPVYNVMYAVLLSSLKDNSNFSLLITRVSSIHFPKVSPIDDGNNSISDMTYLTVVSCSDLT